MKLLKKLFAVGLFIAITLSLAATASAAYIDDSKINYTTAVGAMTGIGAVSGYPDGSFNPRGLVTRAEAAKMIAYAKLGPTLANKLSSSTAVFSDVPTTHWASPYIEYCVNAGIINGMGADARGKTVYMPEASVTQGQLAKMILCANGYGANNEYVGNNWLTNVTKDALAKGIFDDRTADFNAAATREEAAFYIYEEVAGPEKEGTGTQTLDADGWYTIDNVSFGINSNGQNARATTDGINAALDWASSKGYNKVRLTDGTYMIQCNWNNRYIASNDGIMVPSNMTLDLGNAVLKIEPNSYPCYSIIALVNQRNVSITGGTLIGDRYDHIYANISDSRTHEWGFGIYVSASNNIKINNVTIKDTTGDGIILTGSYAYISDGGKISSNISITNCDISNCRRQGISVIGATDSVIAGNTIHDINGTAPEYGIDVEPEWDYSTDNLKIYNNTFYGSAGGAVSCHSGSNYEVYNNTCIGDQIIAVYCTTVAIYNNTIEDSFIRVMNYSSNVTTTDNVIDKDSWVFFG